MSDYGDVRDILTFLLNLPTPSFSSESLATLAAWRETLFTHSAVAVIRPRRGSTSRDLRPMAAKRLWRTAAATMAKSARRKEPKGGIRCVARPCNRTGRLPPCTYEFFVFLSKTCQVQDCRNHTTFAGRAPARIGRQGADGRGDRGCGRWRIEVRSLMNTAGDARPSDRRETARFL